MTAFLLAAGAIVAWCGLASAQLAMPPLPSAVQQDQWPTPSPTPANTLVVPAPNGADIYQGPLTTGTTEPLHYRCEKAQDGTTITLIPLEDLKESTHFVFSCSNCDCLGDK